MPGSDFIPAPHPLPAATRLGLVHLDVADLDRPVDFYTRVIGLRCLERTASQARLGVGAHELLRLSRKAGGRRYAGYAGLYHFCLVVPRRKDFGFLLKRVLDGGVALQGLVDHHVSEAVYLSDPEGNGVELN